MESILSIIGRSSELFTKDVEAASQTLAEEVAGSSFLVLGGAGSIGRAVVREIFKRNPKRLHVVDISENNLAELVRDIRSTFGYIKGEFKTYCLDIGSVEYDVFISSEVGYDYVLNFSALKHVRSEKDPFTLMRMINVNIFNTEKTLQQTIQKGSKKYFCVSTDKAANPVNMMGASKRIMEFFLAQYAQSISISTARFANVAFSDGSLLHSFNQRLMKNQPIAAPNDVRRYFVISKEAGELCLMSCIFGDAMEIFFPKLDANRHLISLADVAKNFLQSKGYEPFECDEEEARSSVVKLQKEKKWPVVFTQSDTTGEKPFEEFFMDHENIDMERFFNIGIVKSENAVENQKLADFKRSILSMQSKKKWSKGEIVQLFEETIPGFGHSEKGKSLDDKM